MSFLCIHRSNQGFQTLTEELSAMAWEKPESKDRMIAALNQMFPALAASRVDEVTRLTETYHKYKREYLKHIMFELGTKGFSKCLKPPLEINIIHMKVC